jgi:hypothetical protein
MAAAEVTAAAEAGSVVVRPVGVALLSRTAFVVLVASVVMTSRSVLGQQGFDWLRERSDASPWERT